MMHLRKGPVGNLAAPAPAKF